MTALQLLPPRQRAVLILRDVLGFRASEVAGMLESTEESVTSALKRARAAMARRLDPEEQREPAPPPGSPAEQQLVARLTQAFESGAVQDVVALLTEDVLLSMPPLPLEYQGRELVRRFFTAVWRGPPVPAGGHAGQRPAGVRVLCPGPAGRGGARQRAAGGHPGRPADSRDDQVRQQRAARLRPAPDPAGLSTRRAGLACRS